jgi:hypothetical protein
MIQDTKHVHVHVDCCVVSFLGGPSQRNTISVKKRSASSKHLFYIPNGRHRTRAFFRLLRNTKAGKITFFCDFFYEPIEKFHKVSEKNSFML